jgi:hypothetical protein
MSNHYEKELRYALDPVLWTREVLKFDPDSTQQAVLRSHSHRVLLNCTRQWGKSTTTAAKAVHLATQFPERLIIAMSPTARQTGELLRKMAGFLSAAGETYRNDGDNEMSFLLQNGSRIVGLPGGEATIRGFSAVSLLIIDEAARVADAAYRAARPMLAIGNGSLLMLSTPFGKRGFFYDEWVGNGPWERIQVRAADCPRISQDFLDDERQSLGDLWFRQEYCCEFLDTDTQLFGRDLVNQALDKDLEPYF